MDPELGDLLAAREAELRRTLALLTEGQRLSKTGSVTINLATDEHFWSDEVYRIFGLPVGGRVWPATIREMIHPADFPAYEGLIADTLKGISTDVVFRVIIADGSTKHVRAAAHVIRESDGTIFHGAIQDISEIVRAEEALSRARDELARVSRITMLSALTASIAHEISQPLAGIVTNASTCLRLLSTDEPNLDGLRSAVARTLRDADRATEIIKGVRALFSHKSQRSAGVDLNATAREVLALTAAELLRSGVVHRTEFAEPLPRVIADRVQMQQVILNLVLNAVDAMRGVEGRKREVSIVTSPDAGGGARLSVSDVGVGVDEAALSRLFDPFYTTKAEGMGIGLAISRTIIEGHGGRLWAQRNNGPGATFSFVLPPEGAEIGSAQGATPRSGRATQDKL